MYERYWLEVESATVTCASVVLVRLRIVMVAGANVPSLDSIRCTLPPKSGTAIPTLPLAEAAIIGKPGWPPRYSDDGATDVHGPFCQPTGQVKFGPSAF